MSTLDDIARQRQHISERLAKLDDDRTRLQEELDELVIAERVLARLEKPGGPKRARSWQTLPTATPGARRPGQRSQRPRAAVSVTGSATSVADAALRAVQAHSEGASSETIRNYLAENFGLQIRANHLGRTLHSHRRAGRVDIHDDRWFPRSASDITENDTQPPPADI